MKRSMTVLATSVAACGLMLTPAMAAAGSARANPKDAKVWAAAEAARTDQLDLLKSVVDIDSGTGDADGGNKVAAILSARLKALGADIQTLPPELEGLADNTVATFTGSGKARILIIGHIDTVFGPGTVAKWSYHVEGDHARGPGVSDEKGGVVEALTALKLLHDLEFKSYGKITFLIETSEERGSPGTRKLIDRLVRENDVELNMEPGDAPDGVTVWRKGSTTYHIAVKGRAAHAGVDPQDGRNAAVELIHQLQTVAAMPHSGPGITANLTVMKAGTRENIIPDSAEASVNVRVREPGDFAKVEGQLKAAAQTTEVPDTTVTVSSEPAFPPLPNNPGTDALAKRAQAIYAGIGRTLELQGNGGASESALAAAAGTPALDGLGPVGGGFHSDKEFLDLTTVTPRLYLMTKLLMDLSANPPKPTR